MVRLLKREYNVHTAENGQEAVTVLDNEDIDPVSYTHLDVYKRQLLHNAAGRFQTDVTDKGRSIQSRQGFQFLVKGGLAGADVYKRQVLILSSER